MIILSLQGIEKSFGTNLILEDICLVVKAKERMGIVGSNGAGKSTLLKIIIGEITPDFGQIYRQKGLSIGYLPQENIMDSSLTIWEELLKVFGTVIEMEKRLREMEEEIGILHDQNPSDYNRLLEDYSKLFDSFTEMGGYSYDSFMRGVLIGLGFSPEEFQQPIYQLSGGQKTRVALAKLLLQKPDLLLLDEPTNHLDLEAIGWLEGYLKDYKGTLILISHDRYFLDALCDSIAEISNKHLTMYQGNYSQYVSQRDVLLEQRIKEFELQQKEIARQQVIIERYRSYNREKSIKAAESREKALARMELVEKPNNEEEISISFTVKKRSGKDVLVVKELSKSFDGKVLFKDVSFSLRAGDRVALIGPNGVGKSTLFKILLNQVPQDSGEFLFGANVDIGYYDQEKSDLCSEKTILEEVRDAHPKLTETHIRNTLARFLFQGDDVLRPISSLSGGEKGRVMIVKLILAQNNLLLLDEPTNHLDMNSKDKLEDALSDYPGTILAISHDRYFINRIANKVMVLSEDGVKEYLGNYNDYMFKKQEEQILLENPIEAPTKTVLREERRLKREKQLQIKLQKERIHKIEESITETETLIKETEELMCQPEFFSDEIRSQEIFISYKGLKDDIERLYKEWEEATEIYINSCEERA